MSDLEENDTYFAQNLTSIQNIHQTGVTEENFEEVNIMNIDYKYYYSIIIFVVHLYNY